MARGTGKTNPAARVRAVGSARVIGRISPAALAPAADMAAVTVKDQPGGARPSGGYGSRDREDQPGSARPAGGYGTRDREDQPGGARPGGGLSPRDREDQPGGYGSRPAGGFGSRDREDPPGGARPGGGLSPRDRTDPPGGASSRFGTSTTDRETSDRAGGFGAQRSASQPSAIPERRSPFGTETDKGKKPDKDEGQKSGGILGRFGSRGKEEKKDDKKPDTSSRSTFGSGQSATRTTGTSPATGPTSRPQTGFGSPSSPARGTPQPTRTPTREDDKSRRGGTPPPKKAEKAPPQPKTRSASRAHTAPLPEGKLKGALTAHQGLDFERKIDLIGVALVGFALVAFFAVIPSMSFGLMAEPETGLTGSLNHLLSQIFGWGKIVWPVFAFGAGVWLMVHSFAETDFELNYFRIFGLLSLYLCALAFIQMFELISDTAPTVEAFKPISHDLAIEQGRGGGWLGHQIYTFLLSQFFDLGTVSVLFAWLVISLMATFDLSVVELWGYVAGVFLFLRPNREARARRQAAREARTADIISAMRPGEEARPSTVAPIATAATAAAATALPTQTQEAPAVQTERRRFGLGRGKTGETAAVALTPDFSRSCASRAGCNRAIASGDGARCQPARDAIGADDQPAWIRTRGRRTIHAQRDARSGDSQSDRGAHRSGYAPGAPPDAASAHAGHEGRRAGSCLY